jgi:hypothetical protein
MMTLDRDPAPGNTTSQEQIAMQAYPRHLKAVFDGNYQFSVPLFQRRYVWNEEDQWEPLWKDVQRVAERHLQDQVRPHFLGAIVFEKLPHHIGTIEQRQIIDGQQRLTTLQLLIAAARDATRSLEIPEAADQADLFDVLTYNSMIKDRTANPAFKVLPSEYDGESFRSVMRAGSPDVVRGAWAARLNQPVGREIPAAYLFFHSQITAWLASAGDHSQIDRVAAIQSAIFNELQVVVIDLEQTDDPQVIFETLNTRGADLLAADLVKNYLLHLAERRKLSVPDLYQQYWKPFDTDSDWFWHAKITQGRLYRPRIDAFLQYYVTLQTGQEVAATKLFAAFQDYAKDHTDIGPEAHLIALQHFSEIFKGFYFGSFGTAEAEFFARVETLDTSTVFPFLLYTFDRLQKPSDVGARRAILSDIESFLVRRVVCGLSAKNYNRLFLELIGTLKKATGPLPNMVRDFLLTKTDEKGGELWPTDVTFRKAWLEQPLYRDLKRDRLRMILQALEMGVRTAKNENLTITKALPVEHLMPQAWQAHWPLPADKANAKEEREALVHTIGNLTLIATSLNSEISNGPWSKKRPAIRKQALLALNRYFQDLSEWDEAAIRKRGASLFDTALKIWSRPG